MLRNKPCLSNIFGCIAIGLSLIAGAAAYSEMQPLFSAGGPDASAYGEAEHYPIGSPDTLSEKKYMVGDFSHFDVLFPAHVVAPAGQIWQFRRMETPPQIAYLQAGNRYSLQNYLSHLPITGLLIAKDDQIMFEGYQYGRTDRDRLTSQSMAKSIVGMLMGMALADGSVTSVSDTAAKYVPELKDSDYGKVPIRDLLHMSSGMTCEGSRAEFEAIDAKVLAHDCKQAVPAGTRFQYSSSDAQLLGLIVTRATKMQLSNYMDQKIWQDIGTEAKATWTLDGSGQETAYCCFNAVLRDYARFARLLAFDGAWNGKQLIPRQWILDATTVKESDSQLVPGKSTPFFGYGYQLWVFPGARRVFALLGANGQRIFVDPQSKLIMAQTAVTEKALDPKADAEMIRFWMALIRHFGES
ncbi:MAG TPA: serine hydrolase [Bryobacteraceae bacterium]|jgi:CubicO group peptidase (beta-lactamase class C family)|nr:serine hydrolase [Bryobacteraceae bacterium]